MNPRRYGYIAAVTAVISVQALPVVLLYAAILDFVLRHVTHPKINMPPERPRRSLWSRTGGKINISKSWVKRRAVGLVLLIPGYLVGATIAQFVVPHIAPSLDYTAGAIGSTVFNTLMLDKWIWLIHRFGGKP